MLALVDLLEVRLLDRGPERHVADRVVVVRRRIGLPHLDARLHELAHRGLEVVVADDAAGDARRAGAGLGLLEDDDVPAGAEPARAKLPGEVVRRRETVDTGTDDKAGLVQLEIDRDMATRLGIDMSMVAGTLNNSFSQRQVSTIFGRLNQYYVVMEVEPRFAQDLESLKEIEVVAKDGTRVPLSAFTRFSTGTAPRSINHMGLLVAESVSFGLAEGVTLSQATAAIEQAMARIQLPTREIQAGFEGNTAQMLDALAKQPMMFLAALVALYIVLGMLYESYMHPLTILSTLPSAGIGALLALMMTSGEFNLIAMIGVFLLIGIVKKNAIMMVDYALQMERERGMGSREAIYEACLVRFRPIMMTTLSAIFGAIPLILASGPGVEMRQPLGVTIVGGLVLSQILTLYTTPVVYLYLDRWRHRFMRRKNQTTLNI